MESSILVRATVEDKIKKMPIEQKVEILWGLVSVYALPNQSLEINDRLFLIRVAMKLELDRSIIDVMLK